MIRAHIRTLACVLSVCMLLGLAACGNSSSAATETTSVRSTETESVTETATKTESATETDLEQPDDAVCYVGTDSWPEAYYPSIEAALADNPDGCDIFMLEDYVMPEDTVLPTDVHFTLTYLFCDVQLRFSQGVIAEYGYSSYQVDKKYISHVEDLFDRDRDPLIFDDLHSVIFWVFEQQGEYAPGRYVIKDINHYDKALEAEYTVIRTDGLDRWGEEYIAYTSGFYFYTLQDAMDNLQPQESVTIHVLKSCAQNETISSRIPGNERVRLAYDWYYCVYATYNWGATYDDDQNPAGYCYINDVINYACQQASRYGTFLYIWSDVEGFLPGKYEMDYLTGAEPVYDEDTDLAVEMEYYNYRLVRVGDIPFLDDLNEFASLISFDDNNTLRLHEAWNGFRAGAYVWANPEINPDNPTDRVNLAYDGQGNVEAGNVGLFRLVYVGE